MYENKPYRLYLYTGELGEEREQAWKQALETEQHGHACECETSMTLANFPELVQMQQVPAQPGLPLGRMQALQANYSGIWWYADFPQHYAGDARPATAEKGRLLRQLSVDALAEYIAAVKKDQVVPELESEFFAREAGLRKEV